MFQGNFAVDVDVDSRSVKQRMMDIGWLIVIDDNTLETGWVKRVDDKTIAYGRDATWVSDMQACKLEAEANGIYCG